MYACRCALPTPLLVLGGAVVAFVIWIANEDQTFPFHSTKPAPNDQIVPEQVPPHPHQGLAASLQPGRPRAVLERRLLMLPPPVHEAVDLSGGTPICRVRYRLHLTEPVPQLEPTPVTEFVPGPYIATLEYDAGVVGHPLVRATITPAPPR